MNKILFKKNFKRKIKITTATFINFLITGTLGYAEDIINNEVVSNFSNDKNGILIENTDSLINNGTISSKIEIYNQGNSILIKNLGNGVLGNIITNSGLLSAQATLFSNSSSISSSSLNGILGNIMTNNGLVSSNGILVGGTLINATHAVADKSLNGVFGDVITNNGLLSGNGILIAGKVGVASSHATSINSLNGVFGNIDVNNGYILGNGVLIGGVASGSDIYEKAYTYADKSLNGVSNNVMVNNGFISGNSILVSGIATASTNSQPQAKSEISNSGNGISGKLTSNNNGVLSGRVEVNSGLSNGKKDKEIIYFSGSGLSFKNIIDTDITNNGLIKGSQGAISASSISSTVNNFGIFAGREIFSDGQETIQNESVSIQKNLANITPATENNYGVYIKLKSEMEGENTTGKVEILNKKPVIELITIGKGGNINGKEIINGSTTGVISNIASTINENQNLYINASNLISNSNLIINGLGRGNGAVTVDTNVTISDSIINGYETAVFVNSEKTFTGTNVIFNGGGLGILNNNGTLDDYSDDFFEYEAVIKGDSGNNAINIFGNSIINGNIDGGDGNDTLNLGNNSLTKSDSNLNIFHKINGFETINTNGNITLFETAKISSGDITLQSGNLTLRIDPTQTNSKGEVIGHALYNHSGLLNTTGGNLIIGANGLGEGTIISMNNTILSNGEDGVHTDAFESEYSEYHKLLVTNSSVSTAIINSNGDIQLAIKNFLPLPSLPELDGILPDIGIDGPITPPIDSELPITPDPSKPGGELPDIGVAPTEPPVTPNPYIEIDSLLYEKLNNIYQSTVEAGEIGNLANTTLLEDKTYNESIGGLLTILDQIYANNPYAYTLKSSRDSLKLFEDNISYLTIKPKENELIVQGKGIYTGVKNDSSVSGKNYYGFDTGHRNYKTTTSTSGGLATFEYGLSDKTSIGFVFGGNNQNTKFKGSSKIDGTSIYLGSFAKTDINNFKFMSGIGYQYTSADVDRKVSNRYDSFSTGDKYNINSLNAFAEAKYIYNVKQDWTIEPKVRLSYYHINQEAVNEGYTPGQLSLKTDKVNSNTADIEFGADFVKNLYLNNGKLKNILSLGVVNTIGDRSKDLNGYILGKEKSGKRFDIQGVELPKTSGKVSYNLEFEQTNGMIYTAGVNLEFAKDYNKNISATLGIGYKF